MKQLITSALFLSLSIFVFGQSSQPSSQPDSAPATMAASAPIVLESLPEKAPHPDRGVYAIWYQNGREKFLDLPYIKGGQIYCQWAQVEPKEGQYDWSIMDKQLKLLHDRNMKGTWQINGNLKPDWMFEKIPYFPKRLGQVENKQGTLMYWHPDFIAAYKRFLRAQADYIRQSPYRDAVLAVRMNFAAIGNEVLNGGPTGSDISKWVVPPGAHREGMRVWQDGISTDYERMIGEEYVKIFLPDIFIFVRAHMDQAARQPFMKYFENGQMGWFHTGAQPIEPHTGTSAGWWQNVYQSFADYVRSGKTLGYSEPIYNNVVTRARTPRAYGAAANYWRLLVDLSYGIDFIACYGDDLSVAYDGTLDAKDFKNIQGEFRAAQEFTAKYAGYFHSPSLSPGAWVALRQIDRPANTKWTCITDDANFLMQRLPDQSKGVTKVGPPDQRFSGWARLLPKGETMRFHVDDRFVQSIAGKPAVLNVTYLDNADGQFTAKLGGKEYPVEMKKTGRWQTATIVLPQAQLEKDADGAQITISAPQDVTLEMVELARLTISSDEPSSSQSTSSNG